MKSHNKIILKLEKNRKTIRQFGVSRLALFGSYAKGTETPDSDLGFIVEFTTKSFDSYMDLKFYLEKLFRRRIDLVLSNVMKPRLRPTILKEAVHAQGL